MSTRLNFHSTFGPGFLALHLMTCATVLDQCASVNITG